MHSTSTDQSRCLYKVPHCKKKHTIMKIRSCVQTSSSYAMSRIHQPSILGLKVHVPTSSADLMSWNRELQTVPRFGLVCWCLTAVSAQTGYIMPQAYDMHIVYGPRKNTQQHKQTKWQKKIHIKNLFHLGFVEVIFSSHKGVTCGVFLANHLAITDN